MKPAERRAAELVHIDGDGIRVGTQPSMWIRIGGNEKAVGLALKEFIAIAMRKHARAQVRAYRKRFSQSACFLGVRCARHDFEHGQEAAELREGIERLMVGLGLAGNTRQQLQRLLDRVDARDSLAFLETQR